MIEISRTYFRFTLSGPTCGRLELHAGKFWLLAKHRTKNSALFYPKTKTLHASWLICWRKDTVWDSQTIAVRSCTKSCWTVSCPDLNWIICYINCNFFCLGWLVEPESRPTFRKLKLRFETFCRAPHIYVQVSVFIFKTTNYKLSRIVKPPNKWTQSATRSNVPWSKNCFRTRTLSTHFNWILPITITHLQVALCLLIPAASAPFVQATLRLRHSCPTRQQQQHSVEIR